MPTYTDQPDFQQSVTPGVVRWAPGTEFGAVTWAGSVAAVTEHQVNYAIPDDGYRYVIDKTFLMSNYVGVLEMDMSVCLDYDNPTWINLGRVVGEGCLELSPFAFISMSIRHPQGLRWHIFNNNNVARTFSLTAGLYKYLAIG
jgi:hypothetical protein